jgi:hypothetical protein
MQSWPKTVDNQERTRRLIDLFLVSVLLDAGAGSKWQYRSKETNRYYRRSEGLAVASLEMFKAGQFSSDSSNPFQVDSAGLKRLDVDAMARGLQVTEANPLDGLDGRTGLLMRLADALQQNQEVFGLEARPGNMLGMPFPLPAWPQLTFCRLPAVTSVNASLLRPHHPNSHSLECSHGQPGSHLALDPHSDRWHSSR